ncbi:unnamed protein product [Dovyalis caffra]|uniref:Trichome birefringence-like N-terminal domain-containing protein n=1 Tax=Dovyalis caffra TaxID=77055 RepID=A0AAV1R3C4_9ROSI|nr:unnamed protein product [Dovyalis caffra]
MSNNSNTSSATPRDTMTHLDFFKKFKRLNPLEPSLGFLGFFWVTLVFTGCFFYLDYRTVTRGLRHHGFLDKDVVWCDVFYGNWVWDDNDPMYRSQDCSFIDTGLGV